MNWVVLQAYGKPEILLEARFLLVTAFRQLAADAGCKVCIYTDNATAVAAWGLPAEKILIREMTAETIAAWKGPHSFVHRLKIEMLRDAAAQLNPEKLLYLDSDMILRGSLGPIWNRIQPGQAVMHEDEGRLNARQNPIMRKMHRFVKGRSFQVGQGSVRVEEATVMRNAGVIGLHQSDFALMDGVLALSDAMYAEYPKHVIEQLAFSFVLGSKLNVYDSSPEFLHYWYAKELRQWLDKFFELNEIGSIENQASSAINLPIEAVAASRLAWKNKASWKRKLLKLFGKEWRLPELPIANS